ncbi:MAG: T9SS type A sorting domain-containing protein [Bacteroidota bacterium]
MQKSWIWIGLLVLVAACNPPKWKWTGEIIPLSEAGEAMRAFTQARANAQGTLDRAAYLRAFFQHQLLRKDISRHHGNVWQALGPGNIAGRMLSLAFHPTDTNLIYAGSASGGLWRSTSQGKGNAAWERMETGWPVLSVGAISLEPGNPDHIWMGTGEVYQLAQAQVPVGELQEMGMYGMGLLRSLDAGESWEPIMLDDQRTIRAVYEIAFHPLDSLLMFVATSEGLYRSLDGGTAWTRVLEANMVTDVALHPQKTDHVWAVAGNLGPGPHAAYFSQDKGDSFTQKMEGLPAFTGKGSLSYSPQGDDIFLVLADEDKSLGLYQSSNEGQDWTLLSNEDVSREKGWYAQEILSASDGALWWGGIDIWRAKPAGARFEKQSDWQLMPMGRAEINAGTPQYVHADVHGIFQAPHPSGNLYWATDGGIFVCDPKGQAFEARNGGLQTTQFHANVASSGQRPDWVVGGLQDNATLIYEGSGIVNRVLGGDGTGAVMHPYEDETFLVSQPFLEVFLSQSGGTSFSKLTVPENPQGERTAFRAPFALSACPPWQLYAAREQVYQSDDFGQSWEAISLPEHNGTPVTALAVSPINSQHLLAAKAGAPGEAPLIYHIRQGMSELASRALPALPPTDLAFHPGNSDEVYLTLGGFGDSHVFRSVDGGENWEDIDRGLLPDVPTHTIFLDPVNPRHIYIGNDLGVYISPDGGESWAIYSSQLAEAVLVVDLSYSPTNRNLRVATFGNGLFETTLLEPATPYTLRPPEAEQLRCYPNPAETDIQISFELRQAEPVSLSIYDATGRLVKELIHEEQGVCAYEMRLDVQDWAPGLYITVLDFHARKERLSQKFWVR